jgi:hypothetical protein
VCMMQAGGEVMSSPSRVVQVGFRLQGDSGCGLAGWAGSQVGFHDNKAVNKYKVERKDNTIINRLEKTRLEREPDLAAERLVGCCRGAHVAGRCHPHPGRASGRAVQPAVAACSSGEPPGLQQHALLAACAADAACIRCLPGRRTTH